MAEELSQPSESIIMKNNNIYWGAMVVVAGLGLAIAAWLTLRPEPAAPRKLTIAVARQPDSALVYIAHSRNYFQEEGLDVTLQLHEFGRVALDAMLEGRADLATVAETPIMMAAMQGKTLAIITEIFSSERNSAVVAWRDKGISTPQDLAGKRIGGTPGTTGDYFLYALLATHGVSMRAIKAVPLRPSEAADALAAQQVDAVSVWNPTLSLCEKRLGSAGVTFFGKSIYTYTFNVATSRQLAADDQKTVEAVLRALVKAERFVRQNPARSVEIVAKGAGLDQDMLAEAWASFEFRLSLEQELLIGLENEARWAIEEHLVERREVPNFLDFIYFGGLEAVRPRSVTILH
jgi:ABC-type nitrate/sulfonate/bicarbonate transport system substrate-binding protein